MKPLNPVMAALLAAASATFASPGLAHAAKTRPKAPTGAPSAPAGDCLKALDDAGTDSVNALTCLVQKKPEARRDIGERLASLLQGKDPGRQYVADELIKDETLMKGVLAIARDWPEKNAKTPAKVAVLYFIIGPETAELPAWAQVPALKTKFKPKMVWNDRFAEMMASREWSGAKQIKPSDAANSAVAFLNDAAVQAKAVLDEPRTKKAIQDSIAANDTTGPDVPTVPASGSPRNPLDGSGSGFGFDDLYVNGAEVKDVYGAKDDGYRRISMKVYSSRDANGNPINRIGIVDITPGDRDTPTGVRYLDISHTTKQTITFRNGGRPYTVEVKANGDVTLAREGMDGGAKMETSIQTLMDDRNRQIMGSGTVQIPEKNGRTYYVLGQGGAKGSVMFFPADDVRADPHGEAHPALMGDVSQVIGDGSTAPVSGNPDLGKLRNGEAYHLEYNDRTHVWSVKPGAGDPPPTAKKDEPAAKPGQTPSAGTTAPGGTADASTLEQVLERVKASGWVESDDANAGFSDAARAKIRILTTENGGRKAFLAVFDPSLKVPDNQSTIVIPSQELKSVRGLGDLVIMTFPTMSQYYDVDNFAKFLKGDKAAQPAHIWTTDSGVQDADSAELMLDMFAHHYAKVSPKLEPTVRQRLAKYAPSGGYLLSGKPDNVVLKTGDDVTHEIWPRDILKNSGTGSNAGLTQQKGPGTVYTLAGGPDGPFPESVSDGAWKRAQADEKSGIALYSGEETSIGGDGGAVQRKRWAIMIRYKKNGGAARSKLQTIFGEAGDADYFAKPKDLHMGGLSDHELGDTAVLRMFTDSSDEGGGVAAYRNPASAAGARDPKANCVGPVLWWGNLTKTAAQKACETDGKAE